MISPTVLTISTTVLTVSPSVLNIPRCTAQTLWTVDVCLERPVLLQSHRQSGSWGYSDRILHVFYTDYFAYFACFAVLHALHSSLLAADGYWQSYIVAVVVNGILFFVNAAIWMFSTLGYSCLVSYFPFSKFR